MKTILLFFSLCIAQLGHAQSLGYILDFKAPWTPTWSHKAFEFAQSQGQLRISAQEVGKGYENFVAVIPRLDLSLKPFVWIKMRVEKPVRFELRLLDANGIETNHKNPVASVLPSADFEWIKLDFRHHFKQSWPSEAVVDSQTISKMSILLNSGGSPDFTGWIEWEEIIFGDSSQRNALLSPILYQPKINQLGYWPSAPKLAIVPIEKTVECRLVDTTKKLTVWKGRCSLPKHWPYSEETVAVVDFTSFTTPGTYRLYAEGIEHPSEPFTIGQEVYDRLLTVSLKSFYYQRVSIALTEQHAGIWTRALGHPDDHVLVHASAATVSRPAGSLIAAPKGWYDAGDFGKYTVPASITVWQLLSSLSSYNTKQLRTDWNIPESGDSIPDLLNEVYWELEWLLAMQDEDGGVYHKLTTPSFGGTLLPSADSQPRYVTQKSTAATLHFAAVLAKASQYFPSRKSDFLQKAENAWKWALLHPEILYDQQALNNQYSPQIVTGDYGVQSGNTDLQDEWLFAATELYLGTGRASYLAYIQIDNIQTDVPSWSSVSALAVLSLVEASSVSHELRALATDKLLELAEQICSHQQMDAYRIGMGTFSWDFAWNSNGRAANQAALLAKAYLLTHDDAFWNAAIANLDYLLGRNPLNKCFVTGMTSTSPKYIHHRISAADKIIPPIPGLLVNGPHNDYMTECSYPSQLPAFAYLDDYCSSATNEVAIYVNSALVYALAAIIYIDQQKQATGIALEKNKKAMSIAPNPASHSLHVSVPDHFQNGQWILKDLTGQSIINGSVGTSKDLHVTLKIPAGIYLFSLQNGNDTLTTKVVWE